MSLTATTTPFLSTIFTPPASCSTRHFTLQHLDGYVIHQVPLVWDARVTPSTMSCSPTEWLSLNPSIGLGPEPQNYAQTSFGVRGVCPDAYTTVGTILGMDDEVTTAMCCPSGFEWVTGAASVFQCMTTLEARATVTVETEATKSGFGLTFVSASTTVIPTQALAFDRGMQVSWSSEDMNSFTPASAPVLGIATKNLRCVTVVSQFIGSTTVACTGTSTLYIPSSTPNQPSSDNLDDNPGLPPAIIGAIVASVVGGLLSIALMALIWWKCFFQPLRRLAVAQEATLAAQQASLAAQTAPAPVTKEQPSATTAGEVP